MLPRSCSMHSFVLGLYLLLAFSVFLKNGIKTGLELLLIEQGNGYGQHDARYNGANGNAIK